MTLSHARLPVIDIGALLESRDDAIHVAHQIDSACRTQGFFYIENHGVEDWLVKRLDQVTQAFFSLPPASKMDIEMARGGAALRGYFPVGRELTSGKPDQKEGLYFGRELPSDHPKVQTGTPLHGPNLFPPIEGFRDTILQYMDALTAVGQAILRGIALGLGLPIDYFQSRYTSDPMILFRVFHYPPLSESAQAEHWSVGEHTDYGLLTVLRQDQTGGLQVKTHEDWIDAPPLPGTFVCNLGDMLDRMTGGLYRSTPHRVRNTSNRSRYSFPFFLDPNWDASITTVLDAVSSSVDPSHRWDGTDLQTLSGTYGEYLKKKVSAVFPDLSARATRDESRDHR